MQRTFIHVCIVFIFCHSATALCTFTASLRLCACIDVLGSGENAIRLHKCKWPHSLPDVVHAATGGSIVNDGSCPVLMAKK